MSKHVLYNASLIFLPSALEVRSLGEQGESDKSEIRLVSRTTRRKWPS